MTERFSFRRCPCGQSRPHGFFYYPDGRKAISLFCSSLKTARYFLQACVRVGMIGREQERELSNQIEAAGLSADAAAEMYDFSAWLLPERGCRAKTKIGRGVCLIHHN